MTTLFTCNFENGALYHPTSGFGGMVVTGGTIECNAASANSGSYGCEFIPLQSYRAAGYIYAGTTLTRFRQAFYLDPNSMTITDTRNILISRNYHDDLSQRVYGIYLKYNNPNYQIQFAMADNSGGFNAFSGNINIADGWNLIETDLIIGASGTFQLWLGGVSQGTLTLNNSTLRVKYPGIGVCEGPSYATSGSFYIDNWRANNDGSAIGA